MQMNIVKQIFSSDRLNRFQDLPALRWEEGIWTYAELFFQICCASKHMHDAKIRPNHRVVLCCFDTPQFIAAYLAVLNIGAVAIAVSTRYEASDIEHVLKTSKTRTLICDSANSETCKAGISLSNADIQLYPIERIFQPIEQRHIQGIDFSVNRSSTDEALWVFSSGSTNHPKGIVHTHKELEQCCYFHSEVLGLSPGDEIFCTSKLTFAYALANGLLAPLYLGASVYLHPNWIAPETANSVIEKENLKAFFAVPTVYRNLLRDFDDRALQSFSKIEHFVSAGEHLPQEIQSRWHEKTGKNIVNVYGCSETLFLCFVGALPDYPPNSVGRLLPSTVAKLYRGDEELDPDSGEDGILRVRHPYTFLHYENQADESRKRLQDGYFVTGDIFRRDRHGCWYHLGREDELIKISGQWVHLREIEKVAAEFAPAEEVAVVSVADAGGTVRPALFFTPVVNTDLEHAEISMRKLIASRLSKLQIPGWIRIIDSMPRTATGKIQRHELQRIVTGTFRDEA